VTIGEHDVELSYAGGFVGRIAGLYRADVRLPDDIEPGDREVLISIGLTRSQSGVTVAVRARPQGPPEPAARTKARLGLRSWWPAHLPEALTRLGPDN
jgi:hypothetical protein